jgi:lipoprotein NlpI
LAHHPSIDRLVFRGAAIAALAFALASCAGGKDQASSMPYEVTLAAAAMQGRDYDEAAHLWTNALALQSLTPDQRAHALGGRAASYWTTGKHDAAMADVNEAIRLKQDLPDLFMLRGGFYLSTLDFTHAGQDFEAAIRLEANSPDAHAARGEVRLAQKQYDLAIADLDLAIGSKPYIAGYYAGRGQAYLAIGNSDRAMQDFDEAVRRDPKSVAAYNARWLGNYRLGRLTQAVADMEQSLALKGDQPYQVIWLHLTRIRMKSGDAPELSANAAKINLSKWPGPVISLYRGNASPDQVLAAGAAAEAEEPKNQKCEADFYVGQYLAANKKPDEGRRLMAAARDTCPGDFYEIRLAEIALGN